MSVLVSPLRAQSPDRGALLASIHERSASPAYAHIFEPPFPKDEARERWEAFRGDVAVARLDVAGPVVGFAAWQGNELSALYVVPEAAGHGVGSILLDAAAGVRRLWVLEGNASGRTFYERRGWRPSGLTRRQYGDVVELEYVR